MFDINNDVDYKSCGWERYFGIKYYANDDNSFNQKKEVFCSHEDLCSLPGRGVYDHSEYDGKLYYLYDSGAKEFYLFSANIDGTERKVITKIKSNTKLNALYVNKNGIFVLILNSRQIKVQIYTHQGAEICSIPIMLDGVLSNNGRTTPSPECYPYICGNKLFLIKYKEKLFQAVVIEFDIKTGTYTTDTIYRGTSLINKRKEAKIIINPYFILGGSDYALLCVNYDYQFYSENSYKIVSGDMTAWYYFSLVDRKMYCLSNPKVSPELIISNPVEYSKYLDAPQSQKHWIRFFHFDIKNKLIWVCHESKNTDDVSKYIVPYYLRPDFYNHRCQSYDVWRVNEDSIPLSSINRFFFDGKHCFYSKSYASFSEYYKNGQCCKWPGGHGACDSFSVVSNTLFIDSELTHNASQFDLNNYVYQEHPRGTIYAPKELRADWRRKDTSIIIDMYNAEKKKKNSKTPIVENVTNTFVISSTNTNIDTGNTFIPDNKLEYWEGFGNYLQGKIPSNVKIPKPADRTWYALRLGSAKIRIECSLSIKKQTLRVGFFMENSSSVYGKAEQHKNEINIMLNNTFAESEIRWDNSVADANVSMIISMNSLDRMSQYEIMKNIINSMAQIPPYMGL